MKNQTTRQRQDSFLHSIHFAKKVTPGAVTLLILTRYEIRYFILKLTQNEMTIPIWLMELHQNII